MELGTRSLALTLGCALWLPIAAGAQSIGHQEYMESCAQCHGLSGAGDGYLAGYLNTEVPDLTTLQRDNGGVFPVTAVYRIIDGTDTSGIHGTSDLPSWGSRFRMRGEMMANPDFRDQEADTYTRYRILALVEYIASIQQE